MGKVPRKINVLFYFACPRVLQRLTAVKRRKRTKCYSLSLCGGIYAAQTGQGFAKNKICLFYFACPRVLQRLTAAKRGKNNVLPQSIPLTPFVRYFAAFSVLFEL